MRHSRLWQKVPIFSGFARVSEMFRRREGGLSLESNGFAAAAD
jgi:hypothetical protein